MKRNNLVFLLGAAALAISASTSFAAEKEGNGGDMCEDRIKIIRDDIVSWIKNGGSAGLNLFEGVSADQYMTRMQAALATAQVRCTSDTITIGNAEKTCKNFLDSIGVPQILCNRNQFLKETSDSDQYVLVHHEYAGLSGIETPNGTDSNYRISNQISAYLVEAVVKKLAVRSADTTCNHCPSQPVAAIPTFEDLQVAFKLGTQPTPDQLQGTWKPVLQAANLMEGSTTDPIVVDSKNDVGFTNPDGSFQASLGFASESDSWTGKQRESVTIAGLGNYWDHQGPNEVSFQNGSACFAQSGYKFGHGSYEIDPNTSFVYECRLISSATHLLCAYTFEFNRGAALGTQDSWSAVGRAFKGFTRVSVNQQ